jgi:hypothetical protein
MTTAPLLFFAAGGMFSGIMAGRLAPRLWLTATLVSAITALAAAVMVLAGGADWEWRSGFLLGGELLHFRITHSLTGLTVHERVWIHFRTSGTFGIANGKDSGQRPRAGREQARRATEAAAALAIARALRA